MAPVATTRIRETFCRLILAVILSVVSAEAARSDPSPLVAGSRALLFQASSDIRLSAFSGATISIKHQTSPGGAWRFGLTTNVATTNEDSDQIYDYDSVQTVRFDEDDRDNFTLGIAVERLKYLSPKSRVSLFFGAGPMLSFSKTTTESSYTQDDVWTKTTGTSSSGGGGLSAVIGVEWFPHEQIGLLGQYGSSASFVRSEFESKIVRSNGPTSTFKREASDFNFRADTVKLGISVYW